MCTIVGFLIILTVVYNTVHIGTIQWILNDYSVIISRHSINIL